jgi:hypothetical protein
MIRRCCGPLPDSYGRADLKLNAQAQEFSNTGGLVRKEILWAENEKRVRDMGV